MKRTRPIRQADAILVGDLHLTDTTPVARTDDYLAAQKRKLEYLSVLSAEHGNCPILCAGDVFDKWKASPWLIAWAYKHLPQNMVTIPGNHDLPTHSFKRYEESALHVLDQTRPDLTVLRSNPAKYELDGIRILIMHQLVWPNEMKGLREIAGGLTAGDILAEYTGYDLILTGDNHMTFTERLADTLLVNPGSMMRSTAAQVDHRPLCYLYRADSVRQITPAYFPIEKGVVSREHLEKKEERDQRIAAYIERMSTEWKAGLSFRQNLEAFFEENQVPQKVREVIWEHLDN